ncbi:MAG TPA: alpha/beta hydrolase [Mycobacteriales bacterium]
MTVDYTTLGDGPLLVCQPGGPGRHPSYLRDLGGLAATRTLLLVPPRRAPMPDLADDLAVLREQLGGEPFDLLAHSAGAVVAQVFARTHPVGRLVLVTPSGRLQGVSGEDVSRRETYGAWTEAARAHAATCDAEMDRIAERLFYDYDTVPDGEVTAETLVVAGGADRLTPVRAAEAVAASIPGARLVVLDGVGHYPWVEEPEAFAGIVERFLAGLPDSDG